MGVAFVQDGSGAAGWEGKDDGLVFCEAIDDDDDEYRRR